MLDTKEHYLKLFDVKFTTNSKEAVMQHTYELNEKLHGYGIREIHRSQFVGTLLVALNDKQPLTYSTGQTTKQILSGVESVIDRRLDGNDNKSKKLSLLNAVLGTQEIRELTSQHLVDILDFVKHKLVPFINPDTSDGQDLLNLFFTTFNKYVGKADKNQAFTPSHIVR
jgi:hypothetical protein